jgi:L-iditol 2-dehydrogenase
MLVARVHGAGDLRVHDEPTPTPGPGEALVRVTAVGVCGSDVHWWREGRIGPDTIATPLVLGHECAGVIEGGDRHGEHVAIDPAVPCGRCECCKQGQVNVCSALRFAGHAPQDGGLRQYMAWPAHCLVPLPSSMSDAEGAMLEPLGVALYAMDLGDVRPGMSVGVFGCGAIGLSVIQLAYAAGATRICATDLPSVPHRLEAARSYGATAFAVDDGREIAGILEETGGRGVDVAFEAAGDPGAVEAAVAAVKPAGRVILIGIASEDRTAFTASTARRKDLTVRILRRMKHTYPRTIRLVESRHVNVRSLVTHRVPLREVARGYALAQERAGIKVVIDC